VALVNVSSVVVVSVRRIEVGEIGSMNLQRERVLTKVVDGWFSSASLVKLAEPVK